jgi:hypothetical protein
MFPDIYEYPGCFTETSQDALPKRPRTQENDLWASSPKQKRLVGLYYYTTKLLSGR